MPLGPLPEFLIIGAMKAGTSTLYDLLRQHPEIGMSRIKETDFFVETKNWSRGLDWYRGMFNAQCRLNGEASPNYTKKEAFAGVPARAASVVPEAKLIFVARDPVDRAVSQYRHALLTGASVPAPEALIGSHEFDHLVETSRYAEQIAAWAERYPMDRFLFLDFDELVATPENTLDKIATFLELETGFEIGEKQLSNSAESLAALPDWFLKARQSGVVDRIKGIFPPDARDWIKSRLFRRPKRSAPPITDDIREALTHALAEDAAKFREMSGLPFKGWSV